MDNPFTQNILQTHKEWHVEEGWEIDRDSLDSAIEFMGDGEVCAAWDTASFGVRIAKGSADYVALEQVYQAFLRKDVMILVVSKGSRMWNRGLNIVIRSRITKEMAEEVEEADRETLLRPEVN